MKGSVIGESDGMGNKLTHGEGDLLGIGGDIGMSENI